MRSEPIDVDTEPFSINLPSKNLLWKNPSAFNFVCSQLVLEADQPIYERLGECNILECLAQLTLQVSAYTKCFGMTFSFQISNFFLF